MHRRTASLLLLVATLLALAEPDACSAQGDGVTLDVESGPAWLRESGIPQAAVGTIGASLRAASRTMAVAASSLGACSAGNRCTAQAVATGALYAPPATRARWETSLTGSTFAFDGGLPVSSLVLGFREYIGDRDRGIYAGGSGGFLRSGLTRATTGLEIGGWWRVRGERFAVGARLTRAPGSTISLDSAAPPPLSGSARSLGDLWGEWRHDAASVALVASAGWRAAPAALAVGGGWAALEATRSLTPRLALVLGAGRALEDPTRGTPAVRYASLSLRVRLHAPPPLAPRRVREGAIASVVALDDSTRQLDVQVAHATSVEVMADFTDWSAVPLARAGDRWTLTRPIAPGPHRLALRIDGGEWRAPANLPVMSDEFGGTVGLITVP